jgi:hypothetical protein
MMRPALGAGHGMIMYGLSGSGQLGRPHGLENRYVLSENVSKKFFLEKLFQSQQVIPCNVTRSIVTN